jgi:hypothetical protein
MNGHDEDLLTSATESIVQNDGTMTTGHSDNDVATISATICSTLHSKICSALQLCLPLHFTGVLK